MILRTAVEDDEILIGGRKVLVREGTHFILNIRDFHMDEEYFPSPSEISLDRYKDKQQAKLPKESLRLFSSSKKPRENGEYDVCAKRTLIGFTHPVSNL